MSVSNQIYSSTIGGINPNKNILVSEGEKLVNIFFNINCFKLLFLINILDRWSKTLRRIMGRNASGRFS